MRTPAVGPRGVLLILAILLPSLDIVHKYLGLGGVLVYSIAGFAGLILLGHLIPTLDRRLSPRSARWALFAGVCALFLLFPLLYPLSKSGAYGGGSDRDDALNQAGLALLHGANPYRARTYLGNSIGALPGGVVLAAPFVAVGNSAYQNFFWILALLATASRFLRSAVGTLVYFVLSFFACAPPLLEFVTGGDQLTTSIYVLCASLALLSCVAAERRLTWKQAGFSVLLGVGLSSRANYDFALAFALPCALSEAAPTWRRVVPLLLLITLTSLGLDLCFYLMDPELFRLGPLHNADKISALSGVAPHAEIWIPLLALLIPPVVWWTSSLEPRPRWLASYATGLACTVVPMVALTAWREHRVVFDYASYGISFQLPLLLLWIERSLAAPVGVAVAARRV